jgi:hypothetical protein
MVMKYYIRNGIKIDMSPYEATIGHKPYLHFRHVLDANALYMCQMRKETKWMTLQPNATFWGTREIKKPTA